MFPSVRGPRLLGWRRLSLSQVKLNSSRKRFPGCTGAGSRIVVPEHRAKPTADPWRSTTIGVAHRFILQPSAASFAAHVAAAAAVVGIMVRPHRPNGPGIGRNSIPHSWTATPRATAANTSRSRASEYLQ